MIWATVSPRSWFCWLYRASPSLAAKNIISRILVLTIWWCPCVESSLVLLEEGVCYYQSSSWQNCISLCPASFCTARPNLPVTPGVSWLPTFAFQSPIMKWTPFCGVSSRRSWFPTENWVKDLLSKTPPIRTRPSFPFSLSHQEASISLLSFPSEGRQTESHSHRNLTDLITWTTALSNSVKLWAMQWKATQDDWVMVESSDKM